MAFLSRNLLDIVSLLTWISLWASGGILITRWAFLLRPNEIAITGVAIGLTVQTWLANLFSQVIPVPLSFWLAAVFVFILGLILTWIDRPGWHIPALSSVFWKPTAERRFYFAPWIILAAIVLIYFQIGRGLAILDDYQNLSTTSLMATGDIPPHFALNPAVKYGYHHFLLLQAAQLMRVAGMYPWSALDLARALTFGLFIVLSAVWVQRVTSSRLAGFLAGIGAAFISGTRWLMLLFPGGMLESISRQIMLVGSGAQSGANLAAALLNEWAIEGEGPVTFPFAFVNSLTNPKVMILNGTGAMSFLILVLLLLTAKRWRGGRFFIGWRGCLLSVVILAALALTAETMLVLLGMGLAITTLVWVVRNRCLRLPKELWSYLCACGLAFTIAFFQGGVLTTAVLGILARWFPSDLQAQVYHTLQFSLGFPPTIFSAHLGGLSLFNPTQLLIALLETGPVILVFPLVCVWGWKAIHSRRWFEAALVGSGLAGLLFLCIRFLGPAGPSAVTRLQIMVINVCALFAVPLGWWWARRGGDLRKIIAVGLGLLSIVSGLVLFSIELIAVQKPVYSYFLSDLDVAVARDYWNKLEPGALVFDSLPVRAPTIFGRPTRSSTTWYESTQEWEALLRSPDPFILNGAGFRYLYVDQQYWDTLTKVIQTKLQSPCVTLLKEYKDWSGDFRWLMDIGQCR